MSRKMSEFDQRLEFKFKMKQEGQRILEAVQHVLASGEDPHTEYTALKPLDQRLEDSIHPARIVNPEDPENYYSYSWNSDQEGISALNWLCLAIAVTGIAVLAYMLAKTQILKFIQFFVTHRYYQRIALSMKPEGTSTFAQSQFKIKLQDNSQGSTTATDSQVKQKLTTIKKALSRTKLHAIPLAQFYTPFVAIIQRIISKDNQVDNAVVLPGYMQAFQIGSRAILLFPLSLAITLLCAGSKCVFSRSQLNFSYECLNEHDGDQKNRVPLLVMGGFVSAIVTAVLMFYVSRSIFHNYMGYLAKFKLPEECIQPMQEIKMSINNSSSRKKSSSNKRKMREDNLKRASVSSFQALLGQDASSLGLESDTESQYDSRMSQNNLSVSTNLNNTQTTQTERLLLASQLSERSAMGGPKKFQTNNPDLVLIEEDEEEQKCSPIKPKRRTQVDSPFKKNFEDDSDNSSNQCCGVELDRGSPLDLNLNDDVREEDQILETPPQRRDSPTKAAQNKQISAFETGELQLPALHDAEDDGTQSEGFTMNKVENLRQSYETGLVLNAQSISENVDYETIHQHQKASRNQSKVNQQSIGSGEGSTLAFDSLLPGLSIPNSAKGTKEYAAPQSVKHATTSGTIGMGLSLAMKSFNRDGNCETQSQDQELSSMRKVDLVSNNGSRPNSVQMINRPSDPIIFDQVFEESKKPEEQHRIANFKDRIFQSLIIAGALVILFGLVFVLYCMLNLSNYGLRLFLITAASSLAFDAAIQLTILIGISAKQVKCEFTHQPLAYNISPIAHLTKETFSILTEIFDNYKEPNALLQVQFNDTHDLDDQLLADIAKDLDLECGHVTPRNNQPDPKLEVIKGDDRKSDVLLVRKQTQINSQGIVADITETTKFKSPKTKKEIKTSTVSPDTKLKAQTVEEEDKSGQELDIYKRKRQVENQLEKQQYLSDKKSTNKKRLRKKSSTKKRDKELAMKIDKFNMNDEINEIPTFKEREEEQNGTPEKLTDEDQKINMAYSSSKKVQKFETPINLERSLSRVGIKKCELDQAEDAMASKKKSSEAKYIIDGSLSNAQKSEQERKRLGTSNRIGEVAGSLGELCISSKSVLGLELQRSSVELLNEGRSSIEMVAPIDPYKDAEKLSDDAAGDGREKYSPIWSSINRKRNDSDDRTLNEEKKPVKIENCKQEIISFPGMSMAPINQGLSRHSQQQKNATGQKSKQNSIKFDDFSEGKVSQASKTIQALVSQREKSISKQHSFNSPTSLNYNINRERCRNSIDNSTIKKGRKLVMLDEAGVSKQSLQFGKSNQSSLIGNILSNTGSSGVRSPTRNIAKLNQTSKNLEARNNSQVEFDVGGCDFEQQEDQIDLENVEDIANSLFSKPAAGTQPIRCENQGILPRKKTKGTILVLRPEDQSALDISSQNGLGQTLQSSFNKKAMVDSQGLDSAIHHEVNKSITETGQDYSGQKTGQTAFQRLVLASKKIIKERSSSKKDRALRSNSQNQTCKLENINGSASSKKLSTRNDEVGFYARPFSITKERSCEKSPGSIQRSTTEPPKGKVVQATAHTMASLKALADLSKHQQTQNTEYSACQIDQIKEMTIEQDSLEVDRKVQATPTCRFDKSQSMLTSNYDNRHSKRRILAESALTDPIKEFSEKEISAEEYKSKIDLKSRMKLRDSKNTDSQFTLNGKEAGTRPNKFITQKNGRNSGVYTNKQTTRRPSHATENQRSMADHQRNKTQSSVDRSEDSFSGDMMDMVKEEEEKDGERVAQRRDRVEDQRRRLESFLTLARQSKSKKDIAMIKDMIHQLDETKKPLPMSRVNDLKQLELMASPYNQSLISMIKVEVDQAKKLRDLRHKEKQQKKFALPKHSIDKSHDEQNVFKLGSDESKKQSHLGSHDAFRGDHISKVFGGPSRQKIEVQEPIRTARNKIERSPYARKHKSPLHSVRPGQNNDRSAERIVFQNIGSTVLNQEHRKSIDRLTCETCSQRGITPMQEKARFQRNTTTAHDSRNARGLGKPSETLSPGRSGPGSFMNQLSQKMSKDNLRSQTSLDMRKDQIKEPFVR